MSEHTPGPWEAYDNDGYSIWRVVAKGRMIARIIGDDAETGINARLIAAAPELLEALLAILPYIPTSTASNGGPNAHSKHVAAADKVRAAISKATGGAS